MLPKPGGASNGTVVSMERQAAQDLFKALLLKRSFKGIDLEKELPVLLTHARSYGFFSDPHTVHELSHWRAYGDKLWELVLDDDKPAKKMSKLWKSVHNELLMVQAEKRAAEKIKIAQDRNRTYDSTSLYPAAPNPPTLATVEVPPQALASAPPLPAPAPPTTPALHLPVPLPQQEPVADQDRPRSRNPFNSHEPVPGAESDLAEAMAKRHRELWAAIARDSLEKGDSDMLAAARESLALPVLFVPNAQGGNIAQVTNLDWKLLAQLRATVGNYGVTSEPVKQMLDYIFNAFTLLPADIKGITKLMYTPHQRLLFEARWREEAAISADLNRPQGDPLADITVDELLGQGQHLRVEAQAALGPAKLREAMAVAKRAMDKVRAPGGIPMYMSIKQGREESLGSFVDKVMEAISRAGVQDHMQDALLKQCLLQNGNHATRSLITSTPGDWTVQQLLEKAANMPTGSQLFLAQALEKLGEGLKEQAISSQNQVMAALAPLQAAAVRPRPAAGGRMKCYRCGNPGHSRRECTAAGIWCNKCQSNTHNSAACRNNGRKQGNPRASANSGRAKTQIAAPTASAQPQQEASAWTWQPQ